jgi:acyl-CoA dehydrogenase
MSEPNAGSDLAGIQTNARKVDGGWLLQGRKIWTSWAHRVHCVLVLCRTAPATENRHQGMSQFIVEMNSSGVSTQPIISLDGEHHFNEVFFDGVFIPDNRVLGEIGRGWQQVMGELAFERSGPERFMSTFPLLVELIRELGAQPSERATEAVGRLVSRLWTLRRMSLAIANLLDQKLQPEVEAALVKDLGTRFEKEIAEVARTLVDSAPSMNAKSRFNLLLAQAILTAPSYTIRGGTNEILRGIVSRRLEV